jgi:hypothetical protein
MANAFDVICQLWAIKQVVIDDARKCTKRQGESAKNYQHFGRH